LNEPNSYFQHPQFLEHFLFSQQQQSLVLPPPKRLNLDHRLRQSLRVGLFNLLSFDRDGLRAAAGL
jgi:hypothetical protein